MDSHILPRRLIALTLVLLLVLLTIACSAVQGLLATPTPTPTTTPTSTQTPTSTPTDTPTATTSPFGRLVGTVTRDSCYRNFLAPVRLVSTTSDGGKLEFNKSLQLYGLSFSGSFEFQVKPGTYVLSDSFTTTLLLALVEMPEVFTLSNSFFTPDHLVEYSEIQRDSKTRFFFQEIDGKRKEGGWLAAQDGRFIIFSIRAGQILEIKETVACR